MPDNMLLILIVVLILAGLVLAMYRKKSRNILGGALLLPAGRGPHTHLADLDEKGDGISSEDMGHRHTVQNTIDTGLYPEGKADHVHDITSYVVDV